MVMATKWGVVSAGKISHDFVTAVRSMNSNEHEFVAVAARSLESAKTFAAVHNIPKYYGSYEELAKDPDIEVVYIGSISSHHFALGKLILENGKHVLIEPPLAMNLEKNKTLMEIARKNKLFLMEGMFYRFLESYDCLMDLIKNGSIGKVVHVHTTLGMTIEKWNFELRNETTIFEFGIPVLNVVSMIFNGEKPERVAAVGHLNDEGKATSMSCSLRYSQNRTASITTSVLADLPGDIIVTGTRGQIKVPDTMYAPTTIQTAEKTYEFHLPDTILPCNYPSSSWLRHEAVEVRKCIQSGKLESSVMPLRDSECILGTLEEIGRQLGVVIPNY